MRVLLVLAIPFVASLIAGDSAAQSNPYVAAERFESGSALGWNLIHAHLASPSDCWNPSYALALNDGPGTCMFGSLQAGQEYSASLPGLRFHPTVGMEFFYSYKNELPTPANVEIAGYHSSTSPSFVVDFTDNTGGNNGNWSDTKRTVWNVPAGVHGIDFRLSFRVWDSTYTQGSGGYYFDNIVVRPTSNGFSFCEGSGCPCLNNSYSGGPERGCRNSTGRGAWLSGYGSRSIAADEMEFVSASLPSGELAWLFQGTIPLHGQSGIPFGNGLLCVGGGLQRLGTQVADQDGIATWRNLAETATWTPGQDALMQVYYRDSLGANCGSQFNTTNGFRFVLAL
ncbi:MAG: hypothetical protein ACI8X5_002633 [Planctomycetota bacterium]|jgi:hypothetical protein